MPRKPDERIDRAKEMYLSGMKLIDISKQLDLPEGTVRRWKSTHKWENETFGKKSEQFEKEKRRPSLDKPECRRATAEQAHLEIKMQEEVMASSVSISRMRPGRFFLLLNRRIRSTCCGTRSRLPMQQSYGPSGSLT